MKMKMKMKMKMVILWWKLSSNESYLVKKVISWWKLSSDKSYNSRTKWWLVAMFFLQKPKIDLCFTHLWYSWTSFLYLPNPFGIHGKDYPPVVNRRMTNMIFTELLIRSWQQNIDGASFQRNWRTFKKVEKPCSKDWYYILLDVQKKVEIPWSKSMILDV